ncbi:DNA import protein CedA1 [Ignicoccus hospitalis]|uniref:Uncharacterized protein n=1 Tax=Ignicoccus hospitalis (strain KIN4/I / DSM 18386 / JCM 14125) TaxID=453591 RepID=A8AB28_IGNH4|nr:DNA import protein CedA1 [Ignicoccus hospitalis]ABU82130.1 hypothetical protein Igni_0950 [Ignicoccus hospitalis KIN4/I]HIH91088.1 hypothetical protein [Desulfurococcaceae archaeon]
MNFEELVNTIQDWTLKITVVAWALVGLSWVLGWALRGAPVPLSRIKRLGHGIVEDAVIAALWLALGSAVFYLISVMAKNFLPQATIEVKPPVSAR